MSDEKQQRNEDAHAADADADADGTLPDDALAQIDGAGMGLPDMGMPLVEGIPVMSGEDLRRLLGGS